MDRRTWLEALAEESAELSQAAIKLIRAEGRNMNPTSVSATAAYQNLLEEVADVFICCCFLDLPFGSKHFQSLAMKKYRRVEERMNGQG